MDLLLRLFTNIFLTKCNFTSIMVLWCAARESHNERTRIL